jgi:hypothetical protein
MIEIVTWLSVLILGPGSVAIFIWFLLSLRDVFGHADDERRRP